MTTPSIEISAHGPEGARVEGGGALSLKAGDAVTFTATPADFGPTFDAATISWFWSESEADTGKKLAESGPKFERQSVKEKDAGHYRAQAGETQTASAWIQLKVTSDGGSPSDPPSDNSPKVLQVAVGEWSVFFGLLSGAVAIVFCALSLNLAYETAKGLGLSSSPEPLTELTAKTLPDRTFASLALITAAAGVVLLIAGAWMAAVEARGRMSEGESSGVQQWSIHTKGLGDDSVKAAAEAFGKLSTMRGTVAVLGCGVILMAVATTGSCQVTTSSRVATTPTASSQTIDTSSTISTSPPTPKSSGSGTSPLAK